MGISQDLYKKAKKIIPGGTQLLSKRPEMHLPDLWPAYYKSAGGCRVTDLDDHTYCDMSFMGIGANVLGYCDEDVDRAVIDAVRRGSMSTLNAPEEVELAELLLELHPWADMVRYAKTGGEALAVAARIARACTGKEIVLVCGYHGWHDWYLAANLEKGDPLSYVHLSGLEPKGVPIGLADTNFIFSYNDMDRFQKLIDKYDGKIAAVIMEPIRNDYPQDGFLQKIRKITEEKDIILVFDEVSAGFRLCCGGAHLVLDVTPDMITMGKALSNGYPMAAIVGKEEVMRSAQDTFISSTYWTERVGLAASVATIQKYREKDVDRHLDRIGAAVKTGLRKAADKHGLLINISGINPMVHFEFVYDAPLVYKTFFTQEMLKRGYLASTSIYVCYAHTDDIVAAYFDTVDEVFELMREQKEEQGLPQLDGEVCHSGFQRLT